MTEQEKVALRAAFRIHAQLVKRQRHEVALPESAWAECRRLTRIIERAERHGWRFAARRLDRYWLSAVDDCRNALSRVWSQQRAEVDEPELLSPAEIYREILSLHDDFDDVNCDFKERVLSVCTEDIVLEGISFGRFEIRLDWESLACDSWYSFVAIDARVAAGHSETTHPHVQSERLCEGDGRAAIRRALASGRLSDFFAIVDRILHTFNPDSAYVRLEQWEGTPCNDCAATVLEDEGYSCQSCHSTLCDRCGACCNGCEDLCCDECFERCRRCEAGFCSHCLSACTDCDQSFCHSCLNEERCPDCHEEHEANEELENENDGIENAEAARPAADSAVQPVCLGEADLSAGQG